MSILQRLRKEKGWSQSQFARISGVNVRLIQKYEIQPDEYMNGVNAGTVLKLCNALGCSVGDLIHI